MNSTVRRAYSWFAVRLATLKSDFRLGRFVDRIDGEAIGGFKGAEPLRMPALLRRLRPNRANYPDPVSATAMLGPLPWSNRKNREKSSIGTTEQGFSGHEHPNEAGKEEFPPLSCEKKGFPCYLPEQGLKSAEQGFIPDEQAI